MTASRGLILLPTRRSARALVDAFLRARNGQPMLLPRITAIGALDETPLALAGALPQPADDHQQAGGGADDPAPRVDAVGPAGRPAQRAEIGHRHRQGAVRADAGAAGRGGRDRRPPCPDAPTVASFKSLDWYKARPLTAFNASRFWRDKVKSPLRKVAAR